MIISVETNNTETKAKLKAELSEDNTKVVKLELGYSEVQISIEELEKFINTLQFFLKNKKGGEDD